LTPQGRRALAAQRQGWNALFDALMRIGALRHA
jgi:hypothetical protein